MKQHNKQRQSSEKKKQMMTKLFVVALFIIATCLTSCKKDDEKAIPDPEGTIECNIGVEKCEILLGGLIDDDIYISHSTPVDIHVNLLWAPPDNFSMTISGYYPEQHLWITDIPKYGYGTFTSSIICNVGRVRGLGDITEIPDPDCFDNKLYSKAGYGYVIKFPNSILKDFYVRMYVVGPIRNTSDKVIGIKVKYQYPFEPQGTITTFEKK